MTDDTATWRCARNQLESAPLRVGLSEMTIANWTQYRGRERVYGGEMISAGKASDRTGAHWGANDDDEGKKANGKDICYWLLWQHQW